MSWKDAKAGVDAMLGGDRNERDVPANQLFQNLELLIESLRSSDLSAQERLRIERQIVEYKERARKVLNAQGFKIPELDGATIADLARLAAVHQRWMIQEDTRAAETLLERLQEGMNHAKMLYHAYGKALFNDARVNQSRVDDLLAQLQGPVQQKCFAEIKSNHRGFDYVLGETQQMPQPSESAEQGLATTQKGTLAKVDDSYIHRTVERYHKLEVYATVLYWMWEKTTDRISKLRQELEGQGGPLTRDESSQITELLSGHGIDHARHLADLDTWRLLGEAYLRERGRRHGGR